MLLNRHSSVVRSRPAPLTSMLPPSRTTRRPACSGCHDFIFRDFASFAGMVASRFQSSYFAQGVEPPVRVADLAARRADEDRAEVARPDAVGRDLKERDP